MVQDLLKKAKSGNPVFITDTRNQFLSIDNDKKVCLECVLELIGEESLRRFSLVLPALEELDKEEYRFVYDYLTAEVFNILTNLGGVRLTFFIDTERDATVKLIKELDNIFGIGVPLSGRKGYGRCVNVIDRMIRSIHGSDHPSFSFVIKNISDFSEDDFEDHPDTAKGDGSVFLTLTKGIEDKVICGVDIGGTDIKTALSVNGKLSVLKEYDWFPEKFGYARLLNDPILLMVRLVRLIASFKILNEGQGDDERKRITNLLEKSMEKDADYNFIFEVVAAGEKYLGSGRLLELDAVGMCFPDVVVKDKIVGGEVTKTRGMRENPEIDYEIEYAKITDLDEELLKLCKPGGIVKNTNDGPMAAFTAAVELAAGGSISDVVSGVFAHTLGTELGTGWVDGNGVIPEIPLETYNMIIDIGSYPEREFPADDVRSINNYNSGLAGTLQRYTSQNGVFRLGLKLLTGKNDVEVAKMFEKGYLTKTILEGEDFITVPTSPRDMRKPFLEYMMEKAESHEDDAYRGIFRQIGMFLAVTWEETQRILQPTSKIRHLFGRLVKRSRCFELMREGAKNRVPEMDLKVADESMANTPLMKQLAEHEHFTVAQFAQAIGAIYYGNTGIVFKQ